MLVIAGPSGSGKSTFFPVAGFGVDSFNIDDRCAEILGNYRAPPRLVATGLNGNLRHIGATPEWLQAALAR
jgi:hypothetical protein